MLQFSFISNSFYRQSNLFHFKVVLRTIESLSFQIHFSGKYNTGKGRLVAKVIGYDCNSMYLCMTAGDMPVGPPQFHRMREDGKLHFEPLKGTSFIAKEWLEYLKESYPDLQTQYDKGEFSFKF